MTGEQLNRRYHELCGWKWAGLGLLFHSPDGETTRHLPDLHTDANLAIAEACKMWPQTRDGWLLESHQGETKLCANEEPVTVHGEGPQAVCEAILKALIAAKEPR